MECSCVSRHGPTTRAFHVHHIWPVGMGGLREPWNEIRVCPNTHANAHMLIRLWGYRYDGEPPWWIRRHFPTLSRELAEQGWVRWDAAGRPVDRQRWLYQGMRAAIPMEPSMEPSMDPNARLYLPTRSQS